MNFLSKIQNMTVYPFAYSVVASQSVLARSRAFFKKPVVHFEKAYGGEKILLLALYQKGCLRPDILHLLESAKTAGMYIVAVNTLKVKDPEALRNQIDCYIEKPNFGRDFGSYKTGFLYIFKNKWDQQCPRLLMLNDSVFYTKNGLAAFLEKMTDSGVEVLGATENYQHEHHLGSFCIAFHSSVLKSQHFKKFWRRYRNTDIRPQVIKYGELRLSKMLRRIVSSPDQFRACYDINYLVDYIGRHKEILSQVPDFYRVSSFMPWQRPSLESVKARLVSKYIFLDPILGDERKINPKKKSMHFVSNLNELIKFFEVIVKEPDLETLSAKVYDEMIYDLLECFVLGSQIHQNAILLIHLGMPLIKLDGLYRGAFAIDDVEKISDQLDVDERPYFRRLMLSRPLGDNTLFGWKRAAFSRGLI